MYRLLTHPKLAYRIVRHILLFVTMVLLFSWVVYSSSSGGFMRGSLLVFTNALCFFGYAYLTVYLLIPYLLARKKNFLFVIAFLSAGMLLSLVKFAFSDYIFYQALAPDDGSPARELSLALLLVNTKDMSFIVAIFALVKFAKDQYILESNIRELQKSGIEAELKLLEHHMDPHVIFNNFNNLYSISIYRPELLKSTVKKLRSFLHYLFSESRIDKVQLVKEVEMIENYIGLEKLRYGDRLDIQFSKSGSFSGLKIAPLILYSFIENCFINGAYEDPGKSWIRIDLKLQDSRLHFLAANSARMQIQDRKTPKGYQGNENSIRRLELQYPNRHSLTIREKRNEHVVELLVSL